MDPRFPEDEAGLRASEVFSNQWYYSAELLPGVVAEGSYPPDLPMLPRLMLRNVDPAGMDCLDIGTMEGLVPALLARRGANRVLAVDAAPHVGDRMDAIRHYHDVDFEYLSVGLLYDLHAKLTPGFDLINLSGVLYHVFSPLMVLSSVRGLLKRGGILEVSTNVIYEDGHRMEWNDGGRLQVESNTFWYPTAELFDYWLRMLKLAPIDCMHLDHTQVDLPQAHVDGLRTGYLSILCRAVDDVVATDDDEWMRHVVEESWEHQVIPSWDMAAAQPESGIRHLGGGAGDLVWRPDTKVPAIDVWKTMQARASVTAAADPSDTHLLRLGDTA